MVRNLPHLSKLVKETKRLYLYFIIVAARARDSSMFESEVLGLSDTDPSQTRDPRINKALCLAYVQFPVSSNVYAFLLFILHTLMMQQYH